MNSPYSSPRVHRSAVVIPAKLHSLVAAAWEYFRLCSTWMRSLALIVSPRTTTSLIGE